MFPKVEKKQKVDINDDDDDDINHTCQYNCIMNIYCTNMLYIPLTSGVGKKIVHKGLFSDTFLKLFTCIRF